MIQERSLLYLGCPSTRSNSILLSGSSSSFLRNASFIKQSSGKEFFSSHSDGKPTHNKGGNKIKLLVIAFGAGAAIGLVYYYRKTNEKTLLIGNVDSGNDLLFSEAPPIDRISKKIVNENDTSNLKLTLYQYEPCPFCKKVRAYLDYAGLSYDVVEVNSVTKKQLSWSPYKKVPIMVVKSKLGYQQLNDSSMIISSLTSLLLDTEQDIANIVRYYPRMDSVDEDGKKKSEIMNRYFLMFGDKEPARTKESITEERNWRKWSDDTLMHTLSPNLYRTWEESLEAFNMFSKNGDWERIFPSWERQMVIYVGAAVMYVIGKRLKKRHNLLDDARQSLYQETNHFLKAVEAKGTLFMGGEEPNLADLAVYGCISSIQGTRSFDDLMSNTSLASWYEPMRTAIENRRGKVIAC
nr:EOG090X08KD [Eurycercus lamellatus]